MSYMPVYQLFIRSCRIVFMKKNSIVLFFLFLFYSSSAQLFTKKVINENLVTGIHSSGEGLKYTNDRTNVYYDYIKLYFEPYIGYFFHKNIGIGIIGWYNILRTNIPDIEEFEQYELGLFARYYFPIQTHLMMFESTLFFAEFSYRLSDYKMESETTYTSLPRLQQPMLSVIPIGLQFKLWKDLYFEFAPLWIYYSDEYNQLEYRIGFEYHFK